jgi:hypothetical protein
MVSELFSGCMFCGHGGGGGKYDFAPPGVPGGGDADDDPVTARSAREHSQKIDRELRRDQRRMQKQVRGICWHRILDKC